MISTSERRAEHPFAGRNTQQVSKVLFWEPSLRSVNIYTMLKVKYNSFISNIIPESKNHIIRIPLFYFSRWQHALQFELCWSESCDKWRMWQFVNCKIFFGGVENVSLKPSRGLTSLSFYGTSFLTDSPIPIPFFVG